MKEAANRRPYYVVCFFSGFTLIAFSMAALARLLPVVDWGTRRSWAFDLGYERSIASQRG
jgi:hypothetical protein